MYRHKGEECRNYSAKSAVLLELIAVLGEDVVEREILVAKHKRDPTRKYFLRTS